MSLNEAIEIAINVMSEYTDNDDEAEALETLMNYLEQQNEKKGV